MLEQIHDPSDLKKMNLKQLKQLAEELREEIIKVVSKQGGICLQIWAWWS